MTKDTNSDLFWIIALFCLVPPLGLLVTGIAVKDKFFKKVKVNE